MSLSLMAALALVAGTIEAVAIVSGDRQYRRTAAAVAQRSPADRAGARPVGRVVGAEQREQVGTQRVGIGMLTGS